MKLTDRKYLIIFTSLIPIILVLYFIIDQKARIESNAENRTEIIDQSASQNSTKSYPVIEQKINGKFVVFVEQNEQWRKVGELSYDKYFKDRSLKISPVKSMPTLKVKIEQVGGGASHIDSVFINGKPPVDSGSINLKKISKREFDVIDATQIPVILTFDLSAIPSEKLSLSLVGRIESENISKTPFLFPVKNMHKPISNKMRFYTYRLGSAKGKFTINGELDDEKLGKPFFNEYYIVGSGHPQGQTFGWVRDDGKYLYVAIDFTSDNTLDGDVDYTKVITKVNNTVKEFKLTVPDQRWGKAGFTYTDKVVYQHKVYEFAIPLDEFAIPLDEFGVIPGHNLNRSIELAFTAYGTASAG